MCSTVKRGRGLMVFLACGVALAAGSANGASTDPYAHLPATVELEGIVRDFRERTATGGHPDFERQPSSGFGHYVGIVADELDAEGRPVFASTGYKVSTDAKDKQGRPILSGKSYIERRSGDKSATIAKSPGGAATTAANFRQWFRDTPGVNVASRKSITLVRERNSNRYVFDDRDDPTYSSLGGFFPINGELFGNSGGSTPNRNHHFTFELDTTFVYEKGSGQVFTFNGDDDVWVFVDGKLVIDIGGVHSRVSQTIDLDRLTWLQDGQRYKLQFFFTERHRTESNFRIETTILLRSVEPPAAAALYD